MRTLVFFLEEPSARALLDGLLPRVLPMDLVTLRFVVFEGRQDLEKQLVRKLRGWRTPDTRFVVLRDQDAGVCLRVKERLAALCAEAGKPDALVRVACRELESWYIGDLRAVGEALDLPSLGARQRSRRFRTPDTLVKPSVALREATNERYQKIAGSRAISATLDVGERNLSHSFHVFLDGVRALAP